MMEKTVSPILDLSTYCEALCVYLKGHGIGCGEEDSKGVTRLCRTCDSKGRCAPAVTPKALIKKHNTAVERRERTMVN